MSGSAGGNRVTRQAVEKTVNSYIEKVLKNFKAFKDAKISGSYNTGTKEDFGDIDLIVTFEGTDKKELKKQLVDYFNTIPDDVIVPFKSEKYKGKKSLSTGEIVTILYPIEGTEDQFVQIDNMVSTSEEESTFKKSFLDYPAEIQGLLLGLTKIVLIEENPQEVFKRLGIKNTPQLEDNQEFEFNLSSAGITLRKVTLTPEFKEIAREDIWKSSNWEDVKKLLQNYDIDGEFEKLLDDIVKNTKNQRSKNRIKGIFKSMITVKSGEVGTPKGEKKTQSINKVEDLLEFMKGIGKVLAEEVINEPGICFYPGGFKPPHKGHFEAAKDLASRPYITQVRIIIGPKERDGITSKESLDIWNIYLKAEPNPKITVKIADTVSPIKDIYEYFQNNPLETPIYVAGGKDEVDDQGYFKSLTKAFGDRAIPIPIDEKFGRISASYTRNQLRAGDIESFKQTIPDSAIQKGYFDDIFKMLSPIIKENFEINIGREDSTIKRYLEEFAEYCYGALEVNNKPIIKVITDDSYTEEYKSFGGYTPLDNTIYVSVSKRNLADIMRSVCHEIVHCKQNESGTLEVNSGETGSNIENQANTIAGIIMRHYGQLKPEIFKLSQMLNEGLAKGKSIEDIAKKHDPKGYYDIEQSVASLKKELAKGIKVEMEHTSDKKQAAKIAMDHLYEDPKYYTKLSKIGLE
jgi:predicted nucleotidyltransferase